MRMATETVYAWTFCPSVDWADHGSYTLDEIQYGIICPFHVLKQSHDSDDIVQVVDENGCTSRGMGARPCMRYHSGFRRYVVMTIQNNAMYASYMRTFDKLMACNISFVVIIAS